MFLFTSTETETQFDRLAMFVAESGWIPNNKQWFLFDLQIYKVIVIRHHDKLFSYQSLSYQSSGDSDIGQ